jgi:IPT/TIG domain/Peptidase M66
LLLSLACGGGSAASNSTPSQPAAKPTISGFQPTSGQVGAAVTITGANLTGATAIAFNGKTASFTVNSATQIAATVPSAATTGKITVTTPKGAATSTANFTVTAPVTAPTITSFTPTSGQVGSSVAITGTNLTGATALSLNGRAATFTVTSATRITTSVPSGATTGKFSVTTSGGTATSANSFTVTTSSSSLDLMIDGLYVTQATQDYPNPIVPLVKDRSGWVRVFVRANQANTATPQVRVQFVNGSTTNTLTINAPGASVPTTIDANTDASWDAAVPSSWIQPGVQVTATVDPSGAIAESDETNNQFSENLDVRTLKTWKVTLVPVHTTNGLTGSVESSTRTRNDWMDFAKRLHPVPDAIDVTVGGTLNSSVASLSANGNGWDTVLNEVSARRSADGATSRYYYGVVKVSYNSGVAGLGFVGFPAAIGWDYSSGPNVLAHEEGHNFGRQHSPCGNPSGVDPNYPYADGIIGVPGWDAFASSSSLKSQSAFTDVMGYCSTQWISDYTYMGELTFRASSPLGDVVPDVVSGNQDGLLVWGRIKNGQTVLEPAFQVPATGTGPQPGPYTWEAHDALGQVVASVHFDAPEVADLPDTSLRIFSFVVPMTQDALNKVQSLHIIQDGKELTRTVRAGAPQFTARSQASMTPLANRGLQISWNASAYPMAMLRDPQTGEVRGFLRGGLASLADTPTQLEVQFSDGISGETVRYQHPVQ